MSNPLHGRPPNSSGSSSASASSSSSMSASSPISVTVQPGNGGHNSSSSTSGGGILKDKVGLPPVYLNLNDQAKDQSSSSCSPLQHWDDTRTADVWLSSLHSVIFIITCALAAFILFRNVLTW